MRLPLLSCALAGALAASTAINLRNMQANASSCSLCAPPSAADVQSCIDCLALTPQQHDALMQACSSYCGESSGVEAHIAELRAELRAALVEEPVDAAAARALGRELAALRGEAIVAAVEAALRVREVLTAEQAAVLEQSLGSGEYR